jgi:hypothetical protein
MKKSLLFLAAIMLLFAIDSFSQASFNTGALQVDIDEYGQIELFSSDGTYQVDRGSILVGSSPTAVFDYKNDAGQFEPTVLVASPLTSDFEIYGAYDNSYSNEPPAVIVKLNAYGWNNSGYALFKFNVMNNGTTLINASVGLDFLPYLNEEYVDSITYNSMDGVIWYHWGTGVNLGMKLLSASLSSLYSFEWYSNYSVDTDYWNWMHYGSLQPFFFSGTGEGTVTITSQDSVALAPGESIDVFYTLALGADEQAMLDNITAAVQKYQILTTSIDENQLSVNEFKNFPNPFKSSTTISYELPGDGFVSLKIYDAIGNEITSLVNSKQTLGSHTIDFNAKDLSSGVYSYRLRFNDQVISNRMILIK